MALSNDVVAKRFADGDTKGAARSMFIDGDTVYSYGSHFPIAKRIPGGYVFNSDEYSMSTATHKSRVWGYIHKDVLWELPGCAVSTALEVYANRVLAAMRKIPSSRNWFSRHLETLEYNFNKTIEASEKLGQDIQPLYNVMDEEIVAAAIKRIKKEGEVPNIMLTVFGKAKFLSQGKGAVAT